MTRTKNAFIVPGRSAILLSVSLLVSAAGVFDHAAAAGVLPVAQQDKQESAPTSAAERRAAELTADIDQLIEQHDALLKDRWLEYARMNIGLAEQSAKTLMVDGKPNGASIGDFHYGLTTFARALDQLPGWSPGLAGTSDLKSIAKPEPKQLKAMAKDIAKVQAKANEVLELQATERIKLGTSTSPTEAADYGSRVMKTIERMLYEGTLEQLSGEGKKKTTEVMKAPLDKLRVQLEALDSPAQDDDEEEAARASADPVKAARDGVDEVRKACEELGRFHSPAAPRVALVMPLLDGLDANLKKLRFTKAH